MNPSNNKQQDYITMNKRRKTAQRKAVIKSTALHIAAMAAFGLWAVGAQLMTQGVL